jgi:WhiB family redox-sensing transcriptional regulator
MSWQTYARCRTEDSEMFFDYTRYEDAKLICSVCPVIQECLADGIRQDKELGRSGVTGGIWGGYTPEERQQLKGVSNETEKAGTKPR